MKVLSVKIKQAEKPVDVVDMYVDKGLISGTLHYLILMSIMLQIVAKK